MQYLLTALSSVISVYMILIVIRILLTWFSGVDFGKPYMFLCSVCDPYLNWFRRFRIFRNSVLDFSPLIALAVLGLVRRLLTAWNHSGRISLGIALAMLLTAVWSVLSWVLGFLIIVLILRLFAYLFNANIYSPFWRLIDFIAQPVLYRINRIFFPLRILNYLGRIILAIGALLFITALLWAVVVFGRFLLQALPL
ncbi:MAG: YggT family protein [Treponema sp.]|jgi:YggT family protein|nr:YggT family protein [Treponema sp.]